MPKPAIPVLCLFCCSASCSWARTCGRCCTPAAARRADRGQQRRAAAPSRIRAAGRLGARRRHVPRGLPRVVATGRTTRAPTVGGQHVVALRSGAEDVAPPTAIRTSPCCNSSCWARSSARSSWGCACRRRSLHSGRRCGSAGLAYAGFAAAFGLLAAVGDRPAARRVLVGVRPRPVTVGGGDGADDLALRLDAFADRGQRRAPAGDAAVPILGNRSSARRWLVEQPPWLFRTPPWLPPNASESPAPSPTCCGPCSCSPPGLKCPPSREPTQHRAAGRSPANDAGQPYDREDR